MNQFSPVVQQQHFFQQPSRRATLCSFLQGATEEALPENCKIGITLNKWEYFHTEHASLEMLWRTFFFLQHPPAWPIKWWASDGPGEAEALNNCTDHHVLERGTLTAARNSNRQTVSIGFLKVHDNGQSHGAGVYQQFQDNKGIEAAHSPGLNSNEHPWKIMEFCIYCCHVAPQTVEEADCWPNSGVGNPPGEHLISYQEQIL